MRYDFCFNFFHRLIFFFIDSYYIKILFFPLASAQTPNAFAPQLLNFHCVVVEVMVGAKTDF